MKPRECSTVGITVIVLGAGWVLFLVHRTQEQARQEAIQELLQRSTATCALLNPDSTPGLPADVPAGSSTGQDLSQPLWEVSCLCANGQEAGIVRWTDRGELLAIEHKHVPGARHAWSEVPPPILTARQAQEAARRWQRALNLPPMAEKELSITVEKNAMTRRWQVTWRGSNESRILLLESADGSLFQLDRHLNRARKPRP